ARSLSLSILRLPATSARFPYTTLFRSGGRCDRPRSGIQQSRRRACFVRHRNRAYRAGAGRAQGRWHSRLARQLSTRDASLCLVRSEEHTSELQSRENLVCRLLLEKKK